MQIGSLALTQKRSLIVATLLGIVVVALMGALAYASTQIDRRDVRIASLAVANSDLQNARSALQDDVNRLTREREELLRTQESLRSQLVDARSQSDRLAADRDRIQAESDRLQKAVDRLQKDNDALSQKLAAPVPTPSPVAAGADRAVVARVLDLDDQIERKFDSFYQQLQDMLSSYDRGDLFGVQAGYLKAQQTAEQLKELFKSRDKAAEPLR